MTRRTVRLRGGSSDRGCTARGVKPRRGQLKRVAVAIAKTDRRGCRHLQSNGRLARKRTSCARTRYLPARGRMGGNRTRWSLTKRVRLPRGSYKVWVRGYDTRGNVERKNRRRNYRSLRVR